MIYQAYQAQADIGEPLRNAARLATSALGVKLPIEVGLLRAMKARCELLARSRLSHQRPPFGIDQVRVDGADVAVTEEVVDATPFGTLLHFKKAATVEQPKVLLVAPMSGHFATLLRGTVRTLLPEHDVYITDWRNARDVPIWHGRFDFDDYTDHVIRFIEALGAGTHVVAVCQPSVAVLVAVALMAAANNPFQPASMTLMGGPIDTRVNPTQVSELAASRPIDWFERNLIGWVPLRYRGAMRRVFPGLLLVPRFLGPNPHRPVAAAPGCRGSLCWGEHGQGGRHLH